MKLTFEPIMVFNKYFFEIDTMFGDGDLYKSSTFEVKEKDLHKTIYEFLAFTQAPELEAFRDKEDEFKEHFKWLSHYPYEWDWELYGSLESFAIIHYDNDGNKFQIQLHDEPNFHKLLQGVDSKDYPFKAIEFIDNLLLKENLDHNLTSNKKAKGIKV